MMMTVASPRWIKKIFFRTARQFRSSKLNFPAHWLRWWSPDLMFSRQTKDEKCLGVRDIDTLGTRASNEPFRSLTLYNHKEGWRLKVELGSPALMSLGMGRFSTLVLVVAFSVIIKLQTSRRFIWSSTGHSGLWGSLQLTSNNHIVRVEAGTTADLQQGPSGLGLEL